MPLLPADLGRHLKALRVIGSLLIEQQVRGRLAEQALGKLLKVALVVDAPLTADDRLDLGLKEAEDERARGVHAPIEIDGTDETLEIGLSDRSALLFSGMEVEEDFDYRCRDEVSAERIPSPHKGIAQLPC